MAIFSSYVSLPEGTGKNAMITGKNYGFRWSNFFQSHPMTMAHKML